MMPKKLFWEKNVEIAFQYFEWHPLPFGEDSITEIPFSIHLMLTYSITFEKMILKRNT